MVSKTVVVLAIILLVLSIITVGIVIMNAPKPITVMAQEGKVAANVVASEPPAPATPVTVTGKVVLKVNA